MSKRRHALINRGDILPGNLLDKTVAETITGLYTFDRDTDVIGGSLRVTGNADATIEFVQKDGTLDNKSWELIVLGENFTLRALNDARTVTTTAYTISRTGTVIDGFDIAAPLTAISYGGITEADLVDKNAAETISTVWNFTGLPTSTSWGCLNPNNVSASVNLNWASDEPRLRVGGTGAGSAADFKVVGSGDFLRASFTALGDFISVKVAGIAIADLLDKTAAETITGNYNFTGTLKKGGRFVVEGRTANTNIIRTMVFNITPGGTPNTNINTFHLATRGFNVLTTTNASNLAKSGSSGDWDLDATGALLAFSPTETIVGVVSMSFVNQDINSSSTTELYMVDANIAAGRVDFRISKRGTTTNLDWLTLLDAGDLIRIVFSFMTKD